MKVRAIIVDGPADPGTLAELRRALDAPEVKIVQLWQKPQIAISDITAEVAMEMGLKIVDVLGHRRRVPLVRARSAIIWLARRLTRKSLPQIAAALWYTNHTSVLHHLTRSEEFRDADPAFRALTDRVLARMIGDQP